MVDIRRIEVLWTTGPGGAGLSVFYSGDDIDAGADVKTFFNAIKGGFPTAVTWQIPTAGDLISSTTGELVGTWTGGTGGSIAGTATEDYAAGTGAYVRWVTGVIRNGRKLQGRTFLCPLGVGFFGPDGTLDSANLAALQTAADTLVGANNLLIWGRPTTPGGSNGVVGGVTGAVVPDRVTSLRTRRS